MLLIAQDRATDSYPVEASGWDRAPSFFVEKSELKWDEVTSKHLTLSRLLSPGSMIFLRLWQPIFQDRSSLWLIRLNASVTRDGQQQFRLSQIQQNSFSR